MKELKVILLLFVFSHISYSQIEWEELSSVNQEMVKPIYTTKSGDLIGYLNKSKELLISYNLGETWECFYTLNENEDFKIEQPYLPELKNYKIAEDNLDNIFFLITDVFDKIIKINLCTFDSEVFLSSQEVIEEFCVLPNNNVVIADESPTGTSYLLSVYNTQREKIQEEYIGGHSLRLDPGPADLHFGLREYGASNHTIKFNTDFSDIVIEEGDTPREGGFLHLNGRYFSNDSYTEDGLEWLLYPNLVKGIIASSEDGTLFLVNHDQIHFSIDNGNSFETIEIQIPADFIQLDNFDYFNPISTLPYGEKGFLLSSTQSDNCMAIHFDLDNGWNKLDQSLQSENPHSEKIEVAS